MDAYLGQIILWPVPWVPNGWQLCDGTLLNIQQNAALYSLIGTTYGGNGTANFAVPDLRSKVPLGSQNMAAVGIMAGAPTASTNAVGTGALTLSVNNLPSHTHTATFTPGGGTSSVSIAIPADSANGTDNVPGAALVPGKGSAGTFPAKVYSSGAPNTTLKPFSVDVPAGGGTVTNASTGSGQAIPVAVNVPVTLSTAQPSLTMNYIIALIGEYPQRP